jgi:RNA polymerase sigma factor (TIGR02999 family)
MLWAFRLPMSRTGQDVTGLLQAWSAGDNAALDSLLPLVERELRRIARAQLARERAGHTLQPTALVNETFLRLVDQRRATYEGRAQFFALAAKVMRHTLIDYARARARRKRGGGQTPAALDLLPGIPVELSARLLDLDRALNKLAGTDERKARVVELRFFGGLDVAQTAASLRVSENTVIRDWAFAKAWLRRELNPTP